MITRAQPGSDSRSFVGPLVMGLCGGVATGLFFGEWTRVLAPAADGFVKLLQMAVLPYVTVSLVSSIGALSVDELRRLGGRTAVVLATIWVLALGCAFLMPAMLPPLESASFFSTTLIERAPPLNLVDLYIPANPFHALANNIVPAVVLFSIVLGIALIGVPRKQVVLDVLATTVETLARVMRLVARLMPYGIFVIAATTAGSLRLDQASRLQIYVLIYGVLALLLALWVLPGLVAALTPIPFGAIFSATRDSLVTATIAGDLFIVLPLLVASCKDLARRCGVEPRQADALPDVIVPMSYNFPHSGKLLSVSFILFAGWFADTPIDPLAFPQLAATSIVTLFGGVNVAMPFLLDTFRVPGDTFQLFLASGVINSRFGTLVAAMHTIAVALLGTCAVAGLLRWRTAALTRYFAITIALTIVLVGGMRAVAAHLTGQEPGGGDVLDSMHLDDVSDAVVLAAPPPPETAWAAHDRLDRIAARRVLRVCYPDDALPFAFFNGRHELIGFDVALMHRLAANLRVSLEFIPVARGDVDAPAGMAALLRNGQCDIGIGGIAVTLARAHTMQISTSYLSETVAFVVRDETRARFESWDAIRASGPLTIAVPNVPYYVDMLRRKLPDARLQTVSSLAELFSERADAIALPAERGSAWTLRYPQYSVVVPAPKPIQVPLAFVTPAGEPALQTVLNTWIELQRSGGALDDLYQYWILGNDPAPAAPRWSIIRNVLHWVR